MDAGTQLRLALAASRYGHGDARVAARIREVGVQAFSEILRTIASSERDEIEREVEDLAARGVYAVLLGEHFYPSLLSRFRFAPPCLFCLGPAELLDAPAIGICGSRNATDKGIRAASACGQVAAERDFTAVSGYARGVDTSTHMAALASGGRTIVVLPEGINRFKVKHSVSDTWDPSRALVVSQFSPNRPWSAGNAMTRNNVIIGLSLALVVVEASEKGGTLAAGMKALRVNKRVIALEFSEVPRGNLMLLQRGAVAVRDRAQLRTRLAEVARDPGGNQLAII